MTDLLERVELNESALDGDLLCDGGDGPAVAYGFAPCGHRFAVCDIHLVLVSLFLTENTMTCDRVPDCGCVFHEMRWEPLS